MVEFRKGVGSAKAVRRRARLFDLATERQRRRQEAAKLTSAGGRGFTREELYERGRGLPAE